MVIWDIGSFHCPEPKFISRGAAEGNKHGQGEMVYDISVKVTDLYLFCYVVSYSTNVPQ